mmetsp:Transcript_44282/g.134879  ORF Transcript_44282/g.134879 Transcript_44282/m.134879 type:complete len:87 (+) Transcript_44282:3059-3319(+)
MGVPTFSNPMLRVKDSQLSRKNTISEKQATKWRNNIPRCRTAPFGMAAFVPFLALLVTDHEKRRGSFDGAKWTCEVWMLKEGSARG